MSKLRTANLLGALSVAIADRLEEQLTAQSNRNDSAASALNLVAMYEGCSAATLSHALKLSHPATLRLIDRLVARGLLEIRSGADRRTNALYLTASGQNEAATTLRLRCAALSEIVDALDAEQQAALDAISETLLTALTTSLNEAEHICRLCDSTSCPENCCPVHVRALELEASGRG